MTFHFVFSFVKTFFSKFSNLNNQFCFLWFVSSLKSQLLNRTEKKSLPNLSICFLSKKDDFFENLIFRANLLLWIVSQSYKKIDNGFPFLFLANTSRFSATSCFLHFYPFPVHIFCKRICR